MFTLLHVAEYLSIRKAYETSVSASWVVETKKIWVSSAVLIFRNAFRMHKILSLDQLLIFFRTSLQLPRCRRCVTHDRNMNMLRCCRKCQFTVTTWAFLIYSNSDRRLDLRINDTLEGSLEREICGELSYSNAMMSPSPEKNFFCEKYFEQNLCMIE